MHQSPASKPSLLTEQELGRKWLSPQPRAPSNAVTLETNILKIWGEKNKIPSSHLPERNKPVPHPSADTRVTPVTGGTRAVHSFLLSPNAKFSHLREKKRH